MGDDTVDGIKVELDSYYGLILKPNMDVTDKVNVFLNLGYADFDVSASLGSISASDSADEFLWGIGAQADFTDTLYGTASFLDVGDTDGFRVSLGFKF
jgi:opacity protein-like surface antigen